MQPEEMSAFFSARVDGYDQHMLHNVDGGELFYAETAKLFPKDRPIKLLDLGCGTGLELDEIFKVNPNVEVTGIDLTADMLSALAKKHQDKQERLHLIQGSYFDYGYPDAAFDVALSVQTMHHFTHEQKIGLYAKICRSVKPGGCYIETDYMAPSQEEEDASFMESRRLRAELGIAADAFYHIDTPCTVENQIMLLEKAGFARVERIWRQGWTAILRAWK